MDPVSYNAYRANFQELFDTQDAKVSYKGVKIITDRKEAITFLKYAAANNYAHLTFIDPSIYDNEIVELACVRDERSLPFVPAEFLTEDFFDRVFTSVWHLQYIPHFSKKMWMCKEAVEEWPCLLQNVPSWMRTVELCKMAYSADRSTSKYIPESIRELVINETDGRSSRWVRPEGERPYRN